MRWLLDPSAFISQSEYGYGSHMKSMILPDGEGTGTHGSRVAVHVVLQDSTSPVTASQLKRSTQHLVTNLNFSVLDDSMIASGLTCVRRDFYLQDVVANVRNAHREALTDRPSVGSRVVESRVRRIIRVAETRFFNGKTFVLLASVGHGLEIVD